MPLRSLDMAAILGRRRSRNKVESPPVSRRLEADADEEHRLRSLFQQHFETKFEPLKTPSPNSLKPCSDPSSPLDTQDEQDWNGLSDNAEGPTVQVVEQSIITGEVDLTDKGELKSFMVRPFSSISWYNSSQLLTFERQQSHLYTDLLHQLRFNQSRLVRLTGKK